MDPAGLAPGTFDVVIVMKFHQAAASATSAGWPSLAPSLLLGAQPLPERSARARLLHWFGGHPPAETNGSRLRRHRPLADRWRRNGYASESLQLYHRDATPPALILRDTSKERIRSPNLPDAGYWESVRDRHADHR